MELSLDMGNTALKYGIFEKGVLQESGRGMDEFKRAVRSYHITIGIMATVVNDKSLNDYLRVNGIPCYIMSYQLNIPIESQYQPRESLGMDRLAAAVAGDVWGEKAPTLVICAGSCITYNYVEGGIFYGGGISPGLGMRFEALNKLTAKLPMIEWNEYKTEVADKLVGVSTKESMVSGVLNGTIQEVQGTIELYRQRYAGLKVAVTGGDMEFLVKNLKNDIFARPDMVLEGLNHILEHNA